MRGPDFAIRLGVGLLLASVLVDRAPGQEIAEYEVKAAYLYNFAKFVDWPPHSFANSGSPIVICVLGEDPFGGALREAVHGKTVAGRRLAVREITALLGARGCHILFIGSGEWRRSHPALSNLSGSGLLTVGETAGFTASGGIIGLKLEGGRIRFQINLEAARQAPIQISSKLLSLAEIVKTQE